MHFTTAFQDPGHFTIPICYTVDLDTSPAPSEKGKRNHAPPQQTAPYHLTTTLQQQLSHTMCLGLANREVIITPLAPFFSSPSSFMDVYPDHKPPPSPSTNKHTSLGGKYNSSINIRSQTRPYHRPFLRAPFPCCPAVCSSPSIHYRSPLILLQGFKCLKTYSPSTWILPKVKQPTIRLQ